MPIGDLLKRITSPRNSAAFTAINLLLGVGPLIIPEPFFRTGFFFSLVWTVIVCLLNFKSASYVGQSILLINKHMDQQRLAPENEQSLAESDAQITEEQNEGPKTIRTFDHVEQIVYLYGQKWRAAPCLAGAIYLLGVSVSKCIMTGNTLSKLFTGVTLLDTYYFWLGVFFLFGASFSFKSIEKTKVVQATMIFVRFLSVFLMVIGAFIIMGQNGGIQDLAPKDGNAFFNGQYFGDIFSNLIFAFMFHHSMPGMTKQLTDLKHIQSFLNIGFVTAGMTMLIIPITACFAFGNDLIERRVTMLGEGGHKLVYYNEDFKDRLDFIYYIVSFYVMLNIAAFSVYIIVIRRNLMAIIKPELNPDRFSRYTAFMTSIILGSVLIISFALREYIQVALNFTGGILGCLILFFLPAMEIIKARSLFPPQKSFLNSYVWFPYFMIVIGVISMVFNLYQTISQLVSD